MIHKAKAISTVYDFLFVSLIVLLPLSYALPNIVLVFLVVFFLVDYKNTAKLDFSPLRKPAALIAFSMVLFWYIKDLITGHLLENKHSLFIIILVLPVLFLKVQKKTRIFAAVAFAGLIIVSRAALGFISYYSAHHQGLPFEGSIVNNILRMERPYLGFITLLSIIAALHLASKTPKYRPGLYLYILLSGIFILMISARISSVSLLLQVLLYLGFYLKTNFRFKLLFGAAILLMAVGVIAINKNIRERFFLSGDSKERVLKLTSYEPRLIIWPCAYQIIQSPDFNPWFGISSEKAIEDTLVQCYSDKLTNKFRADYYIKIKLNTHNQFLGTYLNSGFVGLFLLIGLILIQLITSRKSFVKTAMLTILLLFLLVENVLFRQIGVYFFALIMALVVIDNQDEQTSTETD